MLLPDKIKTHVIPAKAGMTWLVCALLLTACGFQPVYGSHSKDGGVVADQLSQTAIDPIPERVGQNLRNNLIDRFYGKAGRPAQPLYHLVIKPTITEEDLGLLVNATSALAAIHLTANYTLTDTEGRLLTAGSATSTASYDKLTSQYSTLAAHDSALERTAREVSEQLTGRISLYFAERPAAGPVPGASATTP